MLNFGANDANEENPGSAAASEMQSLPETEPSTHPSSNLNQYSEEEKQSTTTTTTAAAGASPNLFYPGGGAPTATSDKHDAYAVEEDED